MKKLLKISACVIGSLAGLLVVAQIVLSPAVATKLVNKFAPRFLDADLSFEKVGISVFRSFPNLSLSLDDALLTYPSDRFSREENARRSVRMMALGRGEGRDTLASFENFRAAVSVPALLSGTVRIPSAELTRPRIFAKMYDDSTANWNIFKTTDKEKDTTSTMPAIKVGRLRLTGDPVIALCDCKDTLYAMLHLDDMSFRGRFNTVKPFKSSGKFTVDSLVVSGRLSADTLRFKLDRLSLQGDRDELNLQLRATARAATRSFGRIRVPMSVDARVAFPEDSVLTANISSLEARVAGLPLSASGTVSKYPDKLYVNADASIKSFRLGKALDEYGSNFWSGAKDISTDAELSLDASAEGFFIPGRDSLPMSLPRMSAVVSIPSCSVSYAPVKEKVNLALSASAATDGGSSLDAEVKRLEVRCPALKLDAKADAKDLLGEDPLLGLDASLSTSLSKLMSYLPNLGITASGDLAADISGSARLSQLNAGKIAGADITGHLDSDRIDVSIPDSGLKAFVEAVAVRLSSEGNTEDESMRRGERMLAVKMDVDSVGVNIKDSTIVNVGDISLAAHSASTILGNELKTKVHPMGGDLSLARVFFRDASGTSIAVRDSKEKFTVKPKDASRKAPLLSFTSDNSSVFFRSGANRVAAKDLSLNASAELNNTRRKMSSRRNSYLDSLSRVYPDVPRDSLMSKARASRIRSGRALPDWMAEADFRDKDLNVNLGETLTKYFKEWNINGGINLRSAGIATPFLPLKNRVEGLSGTFSNDRVELKEMTLRSGDSDITAKGSVWGLNRFLLGRGILNLDLKMSSDVIDADQLLAAFDAGRKMNARKFENSELDDSAYESKILSQGETLAAESDSSGVLIVVPGNLNAKIVLEATEIDYTSLVVDWMEADIVIKERTVQITNTCATSNVGDIYFEGFYSTRSKNNLKTGFYLNLVDITAEKVIDLIPAIDSIMPLLKSFSGMLDCTLAATTSLDEHMNLVIPSMNGVVRIKGTDLEINESQDFYKIAKTLMFRNKRQGHVDKMSVEGYLANSKLEVFPFLLKMDRYKLAISGVQNIDTSFKYHASVLKSPLIFRFGLNLNGNFDDFKLKLARAKYKKESKLPVFSKVIDQATINLSKSINNIFQKGVEAAVAENEKQAAINDFKQSTGYVAVVDMPEDTLSARELKNLEKAEALSEIDDLDLETLDSAKFCSLDSASVARLDLVGLVRKDGEGKAALDTLALRKLLKEQAEDDE